MSDLDKLIEAVEAGTLCQGETISQADGDLIDACLPEAWEYVSLAMSGSLDAAKRLHDGLLPGWSWWIGHDSPNIAEPESTFAHVRNEQLQDGMWSEVKHEAISTDVARAWLLAILRAVKAQG